MSRSFDVVIEQDADGLYAASVPQLPGCPPPSTFFEEFLKRVREAIELSFEVQEEPTQELQITGVQRVTVAA